MSETLAIDFYGARPNPQAIKDAGYVAVLRYLRNLSVAEIQSYHAVGLGVGAIFETAAQESLNGAGTGASDGIVAATQMRVLGFPAGTLLAVNLADFAPTPDQLPLIQSYWQAFLAETTEWHVVPYGTGWLLRAMGIPGWQNAMNDNNVLGSTVVAQAVMYQRVAPTVAQVAGTSPGDYDENLVSVPLPFWGFDMGVHATTTPPVASPVPAQTPPTTSTTSEEPTMWTLTDPSTQGVWILLPDGGIETYDGAPFLGNCAAGTKNNNAGFKPAGLSSYRDASGDGYTITLDWGVDPANPALSADGTGDRFRRYHFPRNGSGR